ncbi:MAG: hypothetical protein ACKO8Z_15825 [Prosthecobacter sp.]
MSPSFHLLVLTTGALLASCASSTMDSIPTGAQMQIFKAQAKQEHQTEFARLEELRLKHVLSEAEYQEQVSKLNDKVVARAHAIAWDQHNLAEIERKSQGIPTPDQPVQLLPPDAMKGGAGGGTLYRNYQQQYNVNAGLGGGSNLGPSLRSSLSTGFGGGGALGRQNYPGSVYDDPTINR